MSDVLTADEVIVKYALNEGRAGPMRQVEASKLIDRLVSLVDAAATPCVWTEDNVDDAWETGCGAAYMTTTGQPPSLHGWLYCPHCSHPIREVPYKEASDE